MTDLLQLEAEPPRSAEEAVDLQWVSAQAAQGPGFMKATSITSPSGTAWACSEASNTRNLELAILLGFDHRC